MKVLSKQNLRCQNKIKVFNTYIKHQSKKSKNIKKTKVKDVNRYDYTEPVRNNIDKEYINKKILKKI